MIQITSIYQITFKLLKIVSEDVVHLFNWKI